MICSWNVENGTGTKNICTYVLLEAHKIQITNWNLPLSAYDKIKTFIRPISNVISVF
jgi:hypothetical protein